MDFASNLKEIRQIRCISQTDLAIKCGLQPSAIAHFESGRRKPSFNNIILLANALQVTADYLLGINNKSASIFKNEDKLSLPDKEFVQTMISQMVKKR